MALTGPLLQVRGIRVVGLCLCFHYTGSIIPLLPKSDISCLLVSSLPKQRDLCRTGIVGNPKDSFYHDSSHIMHVLYQTKQPKHYRVLSRSRKRILHFGTSNLLKTCFNHLGSIE